MATQLISMSISYVFKATVSVTALISFAGFMLFVYQDKMLYFPSPPNVPKFPSENSPGCKSPGRFVLRYI